MYYHFTNVESAGFYYYNYLVIFFATPSLKWINILSLIKYVIGVSYSKLNLFMMIFQAFSVNKKSQEIACSAPDLPLRFLYISGLQSLVGIYGVKGYFLTFF